MVSTDTVLFLGVSWAPLLLAWVFRKRLLRGMLRLAFACVLGDFFVQDVSKAKDGTETPLLRPNAKAEAFLKAFVTGLLAWARQNIKITLPPIPGLGGAPNLGQAAGLVLSGPIKDLLPKDVKPFAGQIGMAIGERVGPWIEKLLGGLQEATSGGTSGPATKDNPFLKNLVGAKK